MASTWLQLILCVVLVLCCHFQVSNSCSCMSQHPQEQCCNADYVIRAKVMKSRVVIPTAPPPPPTDIVDYDTDDNFNLTLGNDSIVTPPEDVAMDTDYYSSYSDTSPDAARVWTVRITKVYKGKQGDLKSGREVELWTPVEDATCGIEYLKKGAFYVFTGSFGSFYSDVLNINMCDWVVEWKSLTRKQKKGIKSTYLKNCQCEIYTCTLTDICMSIRSGTMFPPGWSDNEDDIDGCIAHAYSYCFVQHSACVPRKDGKCGWEMGKDTKKCMST
ncbi:metalloproteinase inhibitor 2-like [Glandiceps talaboti]